MREILFRGKHLDSGKWVYGYYTKYTAIDVERDTDEYRIWLDEPVTDYVVVNPATVGQYTGLNDKHGNRIFEGDIVILNGSKAQYAVFWKNGDYQCGFCVAENGVDYPLANYLTAEYTVVGNIHDNDFKEDKQ